MQRIKYQIKRELIVKVKYSDVYKILSFITFWPSGLRRGKEELQDEKCDVITSYDYSSHILRQLHFGFKVFGKLDVSI